MKYGEKNETKHAKNEKNKRNIYSDWIHSSKGKDGVDGGGEEGGGLLQKEVGEMNRKAGEGSGKTAWRGGRRGKSGVTLTVGQWEGGNLRGKA